MRYVRVYSSPGGEARFEDLEFSLSEQSFAPPAPPLDLSEPMSASTFMVLHSPTGWTDAAHPAPARQFMIMLSGLLEVSAGGESRMFSPGDIILVEDTTGPGHGATVHQEVAMAVVRV